MAHEAEQLRAAVMLRASWDSALERFADEATASEQAAAIAERIQLLREVLDGYLGNVARQFVDE